ncbi:MAG: LapA family protein [bacterium]|nr:LapA family protein [bacterium]MDT8396065.1 LapA family protein [bacterium]
MKYIYSALILLLALFLAAFIQQNGQPISLKYFAWSTMDLPLSLYVILAFAAGYLLAVIVGFSSGIRHKFRTAGAEREVRKLKSELDEVRGKQQGQAEPVSQLQTTARLSPDPPPVPEPSPVKDDVERSGTSSLKGVSADELRRALEDD